jgi:hypothetical protein
MCDALSGMSDGLMNIQVKIQTTQRGTPQSLKDAERTVIGRTGIILTLNVNTNLEYFAETR